MSSIGGVRRGTLLLSDPFLDDPNFIRSVILICETNEEGHLGLILNQRVTNLSVPDVVEDLDDFEGPLFLGGPVDKDVLQFVHRLGNQLADSVHLGDDLYWGGDFEQLRTLINIGVVHEDDVRFFVGYAGWNKGQLESEIKNDVWVVSHLDELDDLLALSTDALWREVMKNLGGKYKAISNFPLDPRMN